MERFIVWATVCCVIGNISFAQKTDTVHFGAAHYFTLEKISFLCDHLNEVSPYHFQPIEYDGFDQLIESFRAAEIDVAFLSPLNYVMLKYYYNEIEPVVVLGSAGDKVDTYRSCVFTYPGSPVKKMKKLSTIADQTRLLFVQPNSTSGHLIPRLYFTSMGFDPLEDYFKAITFSGSHRESILKVVNKFAEIGACAEPELAYAMNEGLITTGDIEILWTSNPIPGSPLIASPNLDVTITNQIRLIFSEIHESEGIWNYILTHWGGTRPTRFVNTSDENYDNVRRIIVNLDNFREVLKEYEGSY
jgi:phosphonate transport system substrate-binding protein